MSEIKFLDQYEIEVLLRYLEPPKRIKHKVLVLLMLDAGLRVSETISLKYSDFDFKRNILICRSLKKRGKKLSRKIPISNRLYQALATYLSKKSNISGEDYLFPSKNTESGYMSRFSVNDYLVTVKKNTGIKNLHPHALRHTFGTQHISKGTPLENIKKMLGHSKYDTTLIYADIPTEILKRNIDKVSNKEDSYLTKFLKKLGITSTEEKRISINFTKNNFSIGRNQELLQLAKNAEKGINTLILGNIGIGKTHLLENLQTDRKILKIDDLTGLKQTLGQLLLYLYENDKEHCKELIYGDLDLSKIRVKINRQSVRNIALEICKAVEPKEYILQIDSVDRITPKGVKLLEELKDYFIIFAAAREVKIDRSSFAWNYDRIELKELPRNHGLDLISKLSYDLDVEDFSLFRNHVFEQSNGNPRVIFEIIDRYRREPVITNEVVKNIRHTASLKEIDLTFVIFIGFGLMYLLRYLSREMDNEAFRFIGGLAMVLALLSRQLFTFTKRKNL